MKRLVLLPILLLVPSASSAQTWSTTVAQWQSMPAWHAEHRSGGARTVVDHVAGSGQRIAQFRGGSLVAIRYVVWAGPEQGSWIKYAGLDACYRRQPSGPRWRLEREAMGAALTRSESLTGTDLDWAWSPRAVETGWSIGATRALGSEVAQTAVSGVEFGRLIRVRVRSGARVVRSSSTRVRRSVQSEMLPPRLVCSTSSPR